jgi:hypothetical protein
MADTTSLDARFASIADRLDDALGHLREAESGVEDPATLHHLDMVGLAIEDARDLASGQGCAS